MNAFQVCLVCHQQTGDIYRTYCAKVQAQKVHIAENRSKSQTTISRQIRYGQVKAIETPVCAICVAGEQNKIRQRFFRNMSLLVGLLLIALLAALVNISANTGVALLLFSGGIVILGFIIQSVAKYGHEKSIAHCGQRIAIRAQMPVLNALGYDTFWTEAEIVWLLASTPISFDELGLPFEVIGIPTSLCMICGRKVNTMNRPNNLSSDVSGLCSKCASSLPKRFFRYYDQNPTSEASLSQYGVLANPRPYGISFLILLSAMLGGFFPFNQGENLIGIFAAPLLGILVLVGTWIILYANLHHPLDIDRLAHYFTSGIVTILLIWFGAVFAYINGLIPTQITSLRQGFIATSVILGAALLSSLVGWLVVWASERGRKAYAGFWLKRWQKVNEAMQSVPRYSYGNNIPTAEAISEK